MQKIHIKIDNERKLKEEKRKFRYHEISSKISQPKFNVENIFVVIKNNIK